MKSQCLASLLCAALLMFSACAHHAELSSGQNGNSAISLPKPTSKETKTVNNTYTANINVVNIVAPVAGQNGESAKPTPKVTPSETSADRTAPVIKLDGDTVKPLQKATLAATTEAGLDILWSMDNKAWTQYEGPIPVTANGTYYFKATDAAGNTGTAKITFANIDRTAPVIKLDGDTVKPLQKATLAATTEAGLDILWSMDNKTWTQYYEGPIPVTANGTYCFKATDAAGNTGTAKITFTNIDRTAPGIKLDGDTVKPLQKATLAATTEAGLDIFWSKDNSSWTLFEGHIPVTANGTYYFKATDAAGNTGTAKITFANIDRTPPIITLSGNTATPTQSTTLTAVTNDGTAIYFSTDNSSWTRYKGEIRVTANGTYYFKSMDTAGNTGTAKITFANIDRTAPVIKLAGDTDTPLQKAMLAAATEDGLDIFWSKDNNAWTQYEAPVPVTANGTYYFKASDAAGNTGTAKITFANIDRTAPVIKLAGDTVKPLQKAMLTATTEAGLGIFWSLDNNAWTTYEGPIPVTANGTYYFKATDAAGNTGTAKITFANIDRTPPVITLSGNTATPALSTTLTAVTNDGSVIYYSTDNNSWSRYKGVLRVTANGTYYFKATDAAGNTGTAKIIFANINRAIVYKHDEPNEGTLRLKMNVNEQERAFVAGLNAKLTEALANTRNQVVRDLPFDLTLKVTPAFTTVDVFGEFVRLDCNVTATLVFKDGQHILGEQLFEFKSRERQLGMEEAKRQFLAPSAEKIGEWLRNRLEEIAVEVVRVQVALPAKGKRDRHFSETFAHIDGFLRNVPDIIECQCLFQDKETGSCTYRILYFRKKYKVLANELQNLLNNQRL